nr:hypothetical protein [Aneurinibacillus sp. XH2]
MSRLKSFLKTDSRVRSLDEVVDKAIDIINKDDDGKYAYYALHYFNVLPSEYVAMNAREKAFIVASIDLKNNEKLI